MNNKPGFAPLDSKSRSGKLIDRVISALQTELNLFGADFLKSNLYDLDYFPYDEPAFNYEWANRVEYNGYNDLIIALGACVQERFKKSPFQYLSIGHPSAVWSHEKQAAYIDRAVSKVKIALPTLIAHQIIKGMPSHWPVTHEEFEL